MKPERIKTIYFSPTGTTGKVAETITEALGYQWNVPVEMRSFNRPADREQEICFTDKDLVIIASPTYAGKLPNKILPDFQGKLRGNGALAVAVVTFGNRSYDHSLAELCAVLENQGFHTVAGGAFVCRHAFTDELGYGRPGWSDQYEMKQFAEKIAEKVQSLTQNPAPVWVPGNAEMPYYVPKGLDGQPVKFLAAKPLTNLSRCSNCGACARVCPMGAIDPSDITKVPGICIKCQACVRKCTRGAKYFDDEAFLSHVAMLQANFREAKENEIYL